ncbi:MAG: DUF4886 domain-containing protein [Paludibacteraceae bacterium]
MQCNTHIRIRLRCLMAVAVMMVSSAWADDTIRVLCIGNSFSWDAVEQELVPLCNAVPAREGGRQPVVIGNLYYGGCSLAQHYGFLMRDTAAYEFRYLTNDTAVCYQSYTLLRALRDYRWDYVSLQQASHDSGIAGTYEPYLSALMDSVLRYQPAARLCWHRTWSYAQDARHPAFPLYQSSQCVMDDSIACATEYVLRNHPSLLLIPCGEAVSAARKRVGDTLCRDGYHLNYTYGRYLASCVWYEVLTGKDVRHNPYRNPGMTRRQQRTMQRIAHHTIHYPTHYSTHRTIHRTP